MKFRSVDCRRVEELSVRAMFEGKRIEGQFFWATQQQRREDGGVWDGRAIWIAMPYDASRSGHPWHCLAVYREGEEAPPHGWLWDGNMDHPTLSPSIACGDPAARDWHGYLTAGRLEACE